jgi:hypothetical protein
MARTVWLVVAVALAVPVETPAFDSPVKAKSMKGEFVTAHAPCAAPTTVMSPSILAVPACAPVPADPYCRFGPGGSGKFGLTVTGTDIRTKVSMVGLSCPVFIVLHLVATLRVTTGDCATGECTSVTLPDFALGYCAVDATGKCRTASTVETYVGQGSGLFPEGPITSVEIETVSLVDNDNGAVHAFTAGLRLGPRATSTTTSPTTSTTTTT